MDNQTTGIAFNIIQVGPDFDYRAFLSHHVSRIIEKLTTGNPHSLLYQIPHPLAAHDDDVWEGRYAPVGDVYFNMPTLLPPTLLEEHGGDQKRAAAVCVRLERLMLQESFQRWGVIKLLAKGLRQHGYRYLILSSITNKPFARYLHEQSKLQGSKWELLGDAPLDEEGQLKSYSVFSLAL
ncbi:hypothetical protein [Oxalicibacterium faecigallinarum]|uniref:Uncharacterized protein n=1 Tax=Oxalicibacterium faecigallinarum TaxID=573741 RepID=A0A8J3EZW6_9BURK|nr:hypothetical protein [Oxalicibacterium faecigallinarum]GGI15712.1 hypothetical protein GCM10008066_00270 [Oxalicibacterium faecigallinarum]